MQRTGSDIGPVEDLLECISRKVLAGNGITRDEGEALSGLEGPDLNDLFALANRTRAKYFGNKVELCSIVNAKSGNCSEDCAYCAQSSRHKTEVEVYDMVETEEALDLATRMDGNGSTRFGIVTAGRNVLTGEDFDKLLDMTTRISERTDLEVCASLGFVNEEQAKALKEAGITRLHHNLETSRSHFPEICTTHTFDQKLETIKNVKKAGIKVCTGGIIGLGETWKQRVELAFEVKESGADSVPINSLVPIEGTRLGGSEPIRPLDFLKVISIFRMVMPTRSISIAAGRDQNLRDLQSMIFFAGANGMMIGNYLTLKGRKVQDDLRMLKDLGLEPEVRRSSKV